jgi:hypothetical protein
MMMQIDPLAFTLVATVVSLAYTIVRAVRKY